MKQLITLVFLLSISPGWGQAIAPPDGPPVTVEVNRLHCLVRFVETLAGTRESYTGSRRAFEASSFNTPTAQRWLHRYRQLDREPGYRREGYPADRLGAQATTAPAYLTAAAAATDLADLQRRTVGLLPNEVLGSLDSVYRFFMPAFEALAWRPHAAELGRQREAYAKFLAEKKLLHQFLLRQKFSVRLALAEKKLMQQFGKLRTFYGSVWPDALPYRIQLSPQLDTGRYLTNHAWMSGNLVLLDCHPASRDFVGGSAIVFHEMSHSLSVQQRLGLQQGIERWYTSSASPNRRAAYYLMEEALATVAGEWMYAQQAGQPEAGSWYQDDYINRYAHALYPLMTSYVARGQELDSTFVGQAISTFDRTFPQAATDYVNLFRKVLYWTDADYAQAAWRPFQERFHSTLTGTATPILGEAEALKMAQSGEYLPVILVTRQHAPTLRYLRQQLPALRGPRLRPEQSFVLSTTGPTGPVVVVCAHNPAQLAAAAAHLEQQGHIDPQQPLFLLK